MAFWTDWRKAAGNELEGIDLAVVPFREKIPPDQGGPPWPYGPDGDCPPDRKRFLQHQKDAICNQPRSCDPKKCPKDDVGEIWRRIRINEACIKARENIMNECYRGRNKAHKDEVQNVRDVLEKCWKAYEAAGGV